MTLQEAFKDLDIGRWVGHTRMYPRSIDEAWTLADGRGALALAAACTPRAPGHADFDPTRLVVLAYELVRHVVPAFTDDEATYFKVLHAWVVSGHDDWRRADELWGGIVVAARRDGRRVPDEVLQPLRRMIERNGNADRWEVERLMQECAALALHEPEWQGDLVRRMFPCERLTEDEVIALVTTRRLGG